MKKQLLFALTGLLMAACQSQGDDPTPPDDKALPAEETEVSQITADVNSAEVRNILGSLFGKERGRSDGYTISLLKDNRGIDRIICINYDNDGGFALLSADKTYNPILAYSDKGNFSVTDSLPFPLSDWLDCTMHDIAASQSLPADSLHKIARKWRRYDYTPMLLAEGYPSDGNISNEEYQALTRKIMDKMTEWSSQGYRYYPVDSYDGTTSLGDKNGIASYVQGIMYPPYADYYRDLTFIVEKDTESSSGRGQWMRTKWEQKNGYNQSFEFKPGSSTERIPVGCGPIAIGQLMYAYKFPTSYNWNAMVGEGDGNKATSDFLLEIKNKCKAHFSFGTDETPEGTSCYPEDIVRALKEYGYKFIERDSKTLSYVQMLYYPAILCSHLSWTENGKQKKDDHAWIVEGGRTTTSITMTEIWTFAGEMNFSAVHRETSDPLHTLMVHYVNWGWGLEGLPNAYYDLTPMIPNGYNSNPVFFALQNVEPNI